MIRIDALWLATDPIDMRMGTERLLAQVVQVIPKCPEASERAPFENPRTTLRIRYRHQRRHCRIRMSRGQSRSLGITL